MTKEVFVQKSLDLKESYRKLNIIEEMLGVCCDDNFIDDTFSEYAHLLLESVAGIDSVTDYIYDYFWDITYLVPYEDDKGAFERLYDAIIRGEDL